MSASLPPDLRVLCRKLSSLEPHQLLHSLPILLNHVVRCKQPLSTARDPKAKGEAAEVAGLVNKLKASLTTLVESRVREARFASIALIKAVVDVGGWEVLKDCERWVRGLLSIIQVYNPLSPLLSAEYSHGSEKRPSCVQRASCCHIDQDLHSAPAIPDTRPRDRHTYHSRLCNSLSANDQTL